MAPILTALTPEQQALLPQVRDEWLAHGLACGPADRETAVLGIRMAYREAGLSEPPIVVWLDSPMAGAVGAVYLVGLLRAGVRDQVRGQVGGQVWGQLSTCFWGQHDAGWLAFYDYFARCGVAGPERLAGLMTVAKSAGWCWLASHRPASYSQGLERAESATREPGSRPHPSHPVGDTVSLEDAAVPRDSRGYRQGDAVSESRVGCCADWPKPCSYHEGWQDALNSLAGNASPGPQGVTSSGQNASGSGDEEGL